MVSVSQFLELPGEIRNQIYGYVFKTEKISRSEPQRTGGYYSFEFYRSKSRLRYAEPGEAPNEKVVAYGFQTAILSTNRQLSIEASRYLYGTYLFICIRSNTNALERSLAMFGMAIGTKVPTPPCDRVAMLVDFTWPELTSASNHGFIIAHQDLRLFLLVLWKVNLRQEGIFKECHIHMEVSNSFGMSHQRLQERLLDHWKRIVEVESVSITGMVQPHYAAELAAFMVASAFNLENLLRFTHTFEEMGCALAMQNNPCCVHHWMSALYDLTWAKQPCHAPPAQQSSSSSTILISNEQKQHWNARGQQIFRLCLRIALHASDTKQWNTALDQCVSWVEIFYEPYVEPPPKRLVVLLSYIQARCHWALGEKDQS